MRECAVNLVLVSAALFAWLLGGQADEITFRDLEVFTVALAVILTLQVLLLYLLNKLVGIFAPRRKEWVLFVAATVLLASNAYFLAFYPMEQTTAFRIACAVVAGAAFLILMVFPKTRRVLMIFAGIMLAMSMIQYGYTRATFGEKDVTAETVSLPIKSKRNVYIIGTESLQSPNAYRENYGIENAENAEHVKVLQDAGFRVLNAFSADRQTLRSHGGIAEFVRPLGQTDLGFRGAFMNDNSTFRSFRDSGYGIQFIYNTNYFTVNRNHVDYVFPPVSFEACENMEDWFFYGLCHKSVVKYINRRLLKLPNISVQDNIKKLRERAEFAATSSRPWLTWTHVHFPHHTWHYYKYPDPQYMAQFKWRVRDDLPEVAENMRNAPAYIAAKDPGAVIAVFGDHGTHLFRGITKDQVFTSKPLVPLDKVLLDQNGVMLAIYPADFCTNRISEGFSTKALIENIIACLNGDDSPTEEERKRARTIRFLDEERNLDELQAKTVAQ